MFTALLDFLLVDSTFLRVESKIGENVLYAGEKSWFS